MPRYRVNFEATTSKRTYNYHFINLAFIITQYIAILTILPKETSLKFSMLARKNQYIRYDLSN